ncbi:histidine phosphatase family protein [Hyalangium rubrum]|uniref:Histidine phosphatase family protein n=1 Tax=Hyalangium rubrum TaxID=3103134 RepID=A0ABU5H841_9BACT|nr:histidine phosphatase family protein [Hyalangium sp. s54d21]MDY7229641.1 histidine phosphatase family protein [Hyalangium sp. s54d21]
MTRLYLVRHGQASFGASRYDQLSALGERQALLLGQHLQRIAFRADAWLSGTLDRQRATLAAMVRGLASAPTPDAHPAFNEYDHEAILGAYLPRVMQDMGLSPDDRLTLFSDTRQFQDAFAQVMHHWVGGSPHERAPFETWEAFHTRIREALEKLARSGPERIVIVTSGGPISLAVQAALGLTPEKTFSLNWAIYNASVTELRIRRGALMLSSFNNVAHLELVGDAGLLTYR